MNAPLHHASGVTTWPAQAGAAVAIAPLPAEAAPATGHASGAVAATDTADVPLPTARVDDAAPVPAAPVPATPATADTAATTTTPVTFNTTDTGAGGAIGGTVAALLLVVAIILVLGRFARRMPGMGGGQHAALRVVGSLALGPRERLVVVDVGGTQLLLATGAGGTRTLHALDAPLPEAAPSAPAFAQVLARQLRQSMGLKPAATRTTPA